MKLDEDDIEINFTDALDAFQVRRAREGSS